MQILQECPHCKRTLRVDAKGKLAFHYRVAGSWKDGPCKGFGKSVLEATEETNNPQTELEA